MLDQKIIRPTICSPMGIASLVVSKKLDSFGKQKWRVVKYRKLNKVIVDDKYSLPNIWDFLDELSFQFKKWHYFLRMLFVLKNAPSTFQRTMGNILLSLQPNFVNTFKPLSNLLPRCFKKTFHFILICIIKILPVLSNKALTMSPVFIFPNLEERFVLTTDATGSFAFGVVFSQGAIGKHLPIGDTSRTLCPSKIRLSCIERDLLAIEWFEKHFRPYSYGKKIKLLTDHRLLTVFSITPHRRH